MPDNLSQQERSRLMARIKGTNTKPEMIVRSLLHRMGYRFRLYAKKLPGSPDLVLPKYKTVVFVHGCFWHRHEGCPKTTRPKTRVEFWDEKFHANVERDGRKEAELRTLGWNVIVVWQCETESKNLEQLEQRLHSMLTG